jgi:hypothetical protein
VLASGNADAHGKLYIALGRNVLALPTTAGIVVVEAQRNPRDNRIPPPDPGQPDGCPDNPRQLRGYAFPLASTLTLAPDEKTSPNQTLGVQYLALFRTLDGDAVPSDGDPIWPGEVLQMTRAPMSCAQATVQEDLPNGLHVCRVKPHFKDNHEADQRSWGGSYTANSYTTPPGRPFVINCSPLLLEAETFHCDVAYVVAPGLGIAYKFQPYLGKNIIPIAKIIDFDKELRARISAAIVPNFSWKSQ